MTLTNGNSSYSSLTHYHTIPTFNTSGKESLRKHCGKRRKCWLPAFSPFPTMFSTLPETNFNFSAKFNLSSANAFNMIKSKILSFGKELKLSYFATTMFSRRAIQFFSDEIIIILQEAKG